VKSTTKGSTDIGERLQGREKFFSTALIVVGVY